MGLFGYSIGRLLIAVLVAMAVAANSAPVDQALAAGAVTPSVSLRYDALPVPFPDGSLLADTAIASGGVPTGGAAIQGVTADGVSSWHVPYLSQELIFPAPVVDDKGDYYWVETRASAIRIVASRGASEIWSKPAPTGGVQSLVVGTDGNLYVLEPSGSGYELNGYLASDGKSIFPAVALGITAAGSATQMFAYASGVIVATPGEVQYFDYGGHPKSKILALTASAAAFPTFAAQPNGDLYAAGMTSGIPFGQCSSRSDNALLQEITSAGTGWSRTLPWKSRCNQYGLALNVAPDGGVVVSSATDGGHASYQKVSATGKDGWYDEVKGPAISSGTLNPEHPVLDANGDLVSESTFRFDCSLGDDYCVGVQFNIIGPGGKPMASPIILQGSTASNQVTWDVGPGGLALTPGIVRASLEFVKGGRTYGTPSYGLYSLDVPGLADEYPQAALWNLMPPAAACSDVLFVGARGSGESGPGSKGWKSTLSDPYGLGGQVVSAENQLAIDLATRDHVRVVSLDYSADGVGTLFKGTSGIRRYFSDLSVGVDRALNVLKTAFVRCPQEKVVLAGYSQGAMVMHRVIRTLYSSSTGKKVISRIASVIFIADGDQVPNDNDVVRFGTAPLSARGIGLAFRTVSHSSASKFSPNLKVRLLSVCNTHDIVCAWTDLNLAKCGLKLSCWSPLVKIHEGYLGTIPVLAAANRAARAVVALR